MAAQLEEGVPPGPFEDIWLSRAVDQGPVAPTVPAEPEPEPEEVPQEEVQPQPEPEPVWMHGFVTTVHGNLRAYIHPLAAAGSGPGYDILCYRRNWGNFALCEGSAVKYVASPSLDDPDQLVATQVVVTQYTTPDSPLATWGVDEVAEWVGQVQGIVSPDDLRQKFIDCGIRGAILEHIERPLLMQLLAGPHTSSAAADCEQLVTARGRVLAEQRRQRLNAQSFTLGERVHDGIHSIDGESFTVEFKDVDVKAAVGDAHSGVAVHLTAFLNSGRGGTLYYGVHDDGYVRGLRLQPKDW